MIKVYCAEKKARGIFLLENIDGSGEVFEIKASDYGVRLSDSDMVKVEFSEDGEILSVEVDKEETEKRKSEMKKKLSSLFDN